MGCGSSSNSFTTYEVRPVVARQPHTAPEVTAATPSLAPVLPPIVRFADPSLAAPTPQAFLECVVQLLRHWLQQGLYSVASAAAHMLIECENEAKFSEKITGTPQWQFVILVKETPFQTVLPIPGLPASMISDHRHLYFKHHPHPMRLKVLPIDRVGGFPKCGNCNGDYRLPLRRCPCKDSNAPSSKAVGSASKPIVSVGQRVQCSVKFWCFEGIERENDRQLNNNHLEPLPEPLHDNQEDSGRKVQQNTVMLPSHHAHAGRSIPRLGHSMLEGTVIRSPPPHTTETIEVADVLLDNGSWLYGVAHTNLILLPTTGYETDVVCGFECVESGPSRTCQDKHAYLCFKCMESNSCVRLFNVARCEEHGTFSSNLQSTTADCKRNGPAIFSMTITRISCPSPTKLAEPIVERFGQCFGRSEDNDPYFANCPACQKLETRSDHLSNGRQCLACIWRHHLGPATGASEPIDHQRRWMNLGALLKNEVPVSLIQQLVCISDRSKVAATVVAAILACSGAPGSKKQQATAQSMLNHVLAVDEGLVLEKLYAEGVTMNSNGSQPIYFLSAWTDEFMDMVIRALRDRLQSTATAVDAIPFMQLMLDRPGAQPMQTDVLWRNRVAGVLTRIKWGAAMWRQSDSGGTQLSIVHAHVLCAFMARFLTPRQLLSLWWRKDPTVSPSRAPIEWESGSASERTALTQRFVALWGCLPKGFFSNDSFCELLNDSENGEFRTMILLCSPIARVPSEHLQLDVSATLGAAIAMHDWHTADLLAHFIWPSMPSNKELFELRAKYACQDCPMPNAETLRCELINSKVSMWIKSGLVPASSMPLMQWPLRDGLTLIGNDTAEELAAAMQSYERKPPAVIVTLVPGNFMVNLTHGNAHSDLVRNLELGKAEALSQQQAAEYDALEF